MNPIALILFGACLATACLVLGMVLASRLRAGQSVLPSVSLRLMRHLEQPKPEPGRQMPARGS